MHSHSCLSLSHTHLSILFSTSSPPLAELASPRHYVDNGSSSDWDNHIQPEEADEYEERKDEVWEQEVSVELLENGELERSALKEVCFAVLLEFLGLH